MTDIKPEQITQDLIRSLKRNGEWEEAFRLKQLREVWLKEERANSKTFIKSKKNDKA